MTPIAALLVGLLAVVHLHFAFSCSNLRFTGYNNEGGGKSVYLDRHHLYCDSRGMRTFHLDRGSRSSMRYQYCCENLRGARGSIVQRYTWFNDDGNGNTVYLDRHNVDCGFRGILVGFRLQRNRQHNRIRFNFQCRQVNNKRLTCFDRTTPYTSDGGGNSVYLDRLWVSCPGGSFLNRFRLSRSQSHRDWGYRYRCCRLS